MISRDPKLKIFESGLASQSSNEVTKHFQVIKRGLVVSGMMPVNEWPRILLVVLLAVPPMWPNGSNPVHLCVGSTCECSVSLPNELLFQESNSGLPVLGVSDFDNKNGSKGEGGCRQLYDLDDEVGNVACGVF